jgi:hypothetical protein
MSADLQERLGRLESEVAKLRGVRGARADLDPSGTPSVRALVLPEGDPSAVRSAIRTLARTTGVPLATDSIQILQADLPSSNGKSRRRRLASLTTSRSDDGFTARVTLELDADVLMGEIEGPTGRRFEQRAIALAVLDALGDLLDFDAQLDNVNLLQVGDTRLAVVQLNSETDSLVGSALVRFDEHDAIARATLAALNRVVADRTRVAARAESSGVRAQA